MVEKKTPYDVLVVGGGIHGCGVARELAGRGYSVCLIEKGDIASGTSSWSTKLLHGGLRYLEQYAFGLVRKALKEREILFNMAPHLVKPCRFVLPHSKALRPRWMLGLGLLFYDLLGGKQIFPRSSRLKLHKDKAGEALKPHYISGFEYSDCCVDDARLVVLNAKDAALEGADIYTECALESFECRGDIWRVQTSKGEIPARLIVNAAGPWACLVREKSDMPPLAENLAFRLIKGSHIVVKRLYAHDKAYIFQSSDSRALFAVPWQQDFTLIGTTDIDYKGDPDGAAITDQEIAYLCSEISRYFRHSVTKEQIIWSFSGVRPIFDNKNKQLQKASRDYHMHSEKGKVKEGQKAPYLISVMGGKLTTYRRLSLELAQKVRGVLKKPALNPERRWVSNKILPGGDLKGLTLIQFQNMLARRYPNYPIAVLTRLVRLYGCDAEKLIEQGIAPDEDGFGVGLFHAEIDYLCRYEWAKKAEDILWRRTKLGLYMDEAQQKKLQKFLALHK